MKEKLVSIITPCYNGEKFIHRYLDSLLAQTYSNVELILVNDGSTDNTEDIILNYKDKFEEKGFKFIYIYQENGGQSSAINKGLKIFNGEYLTWPDSDDILDKNYIKHKVEYFEKHNDVDILICKTKILDSQDLSNQLGVYVRKQPDGKDDLFMDLILERNVYFCPGGYMLRSSSFLKVNPDRHIYDGWAGQNYQLLLPIAYYGKCGYLDEYLYEYLVRPDSHSRQDKSFNDQIANTYKHTLLLETIIKEMKLKEEEQLLEIIKFKYIRRRLELSYQFRKFDNAKKEYLELKNSKQLKSRDKIIYLRVKYKSLDLCLRFIKKILFLWRKK